MIFSHEFYLTAAEVNAQEEMPLSSLVTLVIDVATAHANSIGVGYARMMEVNSSWVLSRLNAEIIATPVVNRRYRMVTWVESLNRLYSDRLFRLEDASDGSVMAWIHTIWMAIDMDSRRPADLSRLTELADVITLREFAGVRSARLQPVVTPADGASSYDYTFKYSDIDVNRHVTTRRYIDLLVDLWPLGMYERSRVSRFEIAFKHEIRYGERATVSCALNEALSGKPEGCEAFDAEVKVDDNCCSLARLTFVPR